MGPVGPVAPVRPEPPVKPAGPGGPAGPAGPCGPSLVQLIIKKESANNSKESSRSFLISEEFLRCFWYSDLEVRGFIHFSNFSSYEIKNSLGRKS